MARGLKAWKVGASRRFDAEVGRRIASLREQNGMTRSELAERLMVSRLTLQRYEDGAYAVPAFLLLRICAMMKVPLAAVLAPAITVAKETV